MSETLRNKITFFESYYDAISDLKSAEEKVEIYDAIFKYAFYGEVPSLENGLSSMFKLMLPNINGSIERNLANIKNGKLGGGQPGNQNASKKGKRAKTGENGRKRSG